MPFAHPDNKIILDYAGASGSSFGGAYEKLEAGWAEAKNITQWKRA